MRRRVVAGSVLILGALNACSSGSSGGGASDAVVSECTGGRDQARSNRIRVEVTNSGSETADYLVAVAQISEESGERIGVTDVHVRAVRPGETAEDYAFGEGYRGGLFWTCEIADVQRLEG